jgi:hypothetical protein
MAQNLIKLNGVLEKGALKTTKAFYTNPIQHSSYKLCHRIPSFLMTFFQSTHKVQNHSNNELLDFSSKLSSKFSGI